jgi:hypothetical protein
MEALASLDTLAALAAAGPSPAAPAAAGATTALPRATISSSGAPPMIFRVPPPPLVPPGISPMEARASLGTLAAGTAHVQQFRTLLHDMPACLAAAAAAGDLVLTNPTVYWNQVSQRVEIIFRYRVVEGGEASLASSDSLLHIPTLLARMAKQLGFWPHDTTMVPDCL